MSLRISAGLPTGMEGLTYPIPFSDPETIIRIAQAAEKFIAAAGRAAEKERARQAEEAARAAQQAQLDEQAARPTTEAP